MKVQILGLRTYIDSEGKERTAEKFFEKGWRSESVPLLFLNTDKILNEIPKDEHYNLYYTIALCKEEAGRKMVYQDCIPFDIDGIDQKLIHLYYQPICEVLGIQYEKTGIVASGNGIQIIVQSTNTVLTTIDEFKKLALSYKAVCQRIHQRLKSLNLIGTVDTAVWSPARLMRLPGTENRKPTKGVKQAVMINATILPQELDLEALGGVGKLGPEDELPLLTPDFTAPDTEAVLSSCNYLQWCKAHGSEVSEPQWYAMLSILARCEDGINLCHEYSKNHPDYSPEDTTSKINQSVTTARPRTCANIATLWDGCTNCGQRGKVKSPIIIKGPNCIDTKATGFWIMGMNKDGKLVPKVPDYEGLMRFFNQQHNFRSIDGTRILVYEKTHWTEKLNVYMEAFAEQWFNPTPSIAQRREFLGKLRVNNIVSSEWLALTTKQKINFSNGIYDIESRTLAPHSKDVGFFYVLPHAYNPTATCPRFDSFMEEITNNRKELEYVLLEYMAFALSGTVYNPAKVLLLVGDGANGKSTFLNILKNLVGKNAYSVEGMDELRDETHRYSIIDSLFNIAEETPKKALLEASWFKTIVGGGEITARLKFCNPVKFVNRCKLMFACNELPANNDATFGLWRRMLIVPFDARFTGKNDDNRLDDKLKLESEGIFNRILEAYKRFEENGFQFIESAIVDAVVEEYRVESNTILSWIADQVQFIPIKDKNEAVEMRRKNQWISNAKIYELYALWCKIGNVYPISRSKMMNMFGKHCMKIDMHELRGGKNCAQDTRVTFGIKIEGYSHEI